MLKSLTINNYALIDELEIDFSKGLTIITGETGAGKSILLGALGLIVGQRADTQVLQNKTKKCLIEGKFNIKEYNLKDFFEKNELDYENDTTIRREINPEGKSRAFINDTPVTLHQLKELGTRLIDIHSQHETLMLNNRDFQLSVVDAYAGHHDLLNEFKSGYKKYKALQTELNDLESKEAESKKELDYFQFQFNELEAANLKEGEQEKMEEELETLNNSENIKEELSKSINILSGGEQNLLGSLNEVKSIVSRIGKFNQNIFNLNERLNSAYIELKDISDEAENIQSEINYDPERIELLNTKLDEMYRLQQKHRVNTIAELISLKDSLSDKLQDISSLEDKIFSLKKELESVHQKLKTVSEKISSNRKKVFKKIEEDIASLLSQLSMPNAQFKVEHSVSENFTSTGTDNIQFLFSANKGSDFKELHKVASGGELSRLMLSIKSLIAKFTALPTIIFDEIDTGVSGNVAAKVGSIMDLMAKDMQVITITHLPQIAGRGEEHLFVYKEEKNNQTFTRIRKLKKQERVEEIAKMLSAGEPTAAALKNAKELLEA